MSKPYISLCFSVFFLLSVFHSANSEEKIISIESVGKTEEEAGAFEELHSYFKITLKKHVREAIGKINVVIYFFEIPKTVQGKKIGNKDVVLSARQELSPFLPWDRNNRLFISTSFYPSVRAGFVFYGYLVRVYAGDSLADELAEPPHLKDKSFLQNKAII
ncbi:MAG: hypothetical protein PHO00_07985 [bacterium]|nr:hypothetical protein [bacterium]